MKKVYVSVYNYEEIADYIKVLNEKFNYEIVSSGATLEYLVKKGLNVIDISELGISDGFYTRTFMENFVHKNFDMVIINFRPVEDIVEKTDDIRQFMESINILDFSILRAAAKDFQDTIVVTEVSDFYKTIYVNSYDKQKLALKAFQYMADYDEAIAEKIGVYSGEDERKLLNMAKIYEFKYGANPHQKASMYKPEKMADYRLLNDTQLSYNDILNLSLAVNLISEFYDVSAVAIAKHNLPCGMALGRNIFEAYTKAFDCDPFAAFSGTIAFSQNVDFEVAKHLGSMPVKVVVAPYFEEDALEYLKKHSDIKIVRLMTELKNFRKMIIDEIKLTPFGALVQESNKSELDKDLFKVVTKVKPTAEQLEDAIFAWKIVKHARTNSALVAKDFKTLAITQGHTNLVSAIEQAMDVSCENSKDAILAVDEAIQAGECINAAAQGRISLIIQPGGSIRDKEVIAAADKYNISMVFTGIRNLTF